MSSGGGFTPMLEDEAPIRDFLLGKTPEDDRDEFEKRLLTDKDFSEWVSAIEEELIDDYTSGLLYGDERHRFEASFLVTEERRRRVQFSAALARVKAGLERVEVKAPVAHPGYFWMQVAAAAVVAVCLGAALWMAYAMGGTLDQLAAAEKRVADLEQAQQSIIEDYRRRIADAEDKAREALEAAEAAASRPQPETLPLVVATLLPGALRDPGTEVPSVRIPPAALLAELRLELPEDSESSYVASVHDPSGTEMFRASGLKAETVRDRILLPLQVPADSLPPGDYSIRLWGNQNGELTELDRYYVRIRTR
jgi:hypothetical protein